MGVPLIEKIELVEGILPVIGMDAAAQLLSDLSDGGLTVLGARECLTRGATATRRDYERIFANARKSLIESRIQQALDEGVGCWNLDPDPKDQR